MRYLFGYIKYDLDVEDGLLVVHAPNGYGKSTLIKCIKYFSFGDLINLFNSPYIVNYPDTKVGNPEYETE